MKAVILAGGLGKRLGKYTKNLPKCMLNFLGKTLIERQVETFRKCGIHDIIITRKHLKEKINISGVKYDDKENDDSNMLADFFHAIKEVDDDIILSYGDILFETDVLNKFIKFKGEVGVIGDTDWKEYWNNRIGSWTEDSESFVIGQEDKIISLGIPNPPVEDMHARYIGLIKFSKQVLPRIKKIYKDAAKNFWDKSWHTSKSLKKAYMTDFLQELIDKGFDVKAVKIQKGWLEFDTVKDYEMGLEWAKQGTLNRFIKID